MSAALAVLPGCCELGKPICSAGSVRVPDVIWSGVLSGRVVPFDVEHRVEQTCCAMPCRFAIDFSVQSVGENAAARGAAAHVGERLIVCVQGSLAYDEVSRACVGGDLSSS